jgi:quercetin dioxygenase-like cupin family protein
MGETVRVIDASQSREIPIVDGAGSARVVIWPGMGAMYRTFQVIELKGASKTKPLRHPSSDAAYYVLDGEGKVLDVATGEYQELAEGGMVHIDANDQYQFVAGGKGLSILGGPCPADATLYESLGS